jgi:hypothetical protein
VLHNTEGKCMFFFKEAELLDWRSVTRKEYHSRGANTQTQAGGRLKCQCRVQRI